MILTSADVVSSPHHAWINYNGFENMGDFKSEWQQEQYEHQNHIPQISSCDLMLPVQT